jgi:hypothetical protein
MPTMQLEPVEKELCGKIAHGDSYTVPAGSKPIRAEVLRHIALGLPLFAEDGKAGEFQCVTHQAPQGRACPRTSVGIRLIGGRIDGRLKLDSASGEDGGPLMPLHFEGVALDGGFSGADGHFSHLSFQGCTFLDDRKSEKKLPSIDLSNSRIESDLDLSKTLPNGSALPDDEGWPGSNPWQDPILAGSNHHWIKLGGARVAGMIDLCGSYLRAPAGADAAKALDLSLIEAGGDFHFRRGSCAAGQIWAKNAHFRGDFWLSGARLDGRKGQSIMLQSATIDGMLVIDSRHDDQGPGAVFRWFSARGEINFHGLRLGGRLVIKNATIIPSADARPSTVPALPGTAEKPPEAPCHVGLCLHAARLPGLSITSDPGRPTQMLGLIQLDGLEVDGAVELSNLRLGREGGPSRRATLDARGLQAGVVKMTNLVPAPPAEGAEPRELSLDLEYATLRELDVSRCFFTGPVRAESLTCHGDVTLGASTGGLVSLEHATVEGTLDLSHLQIEAESGRLALAEAEIGRALKLRRSDPDDGELGFSLSGVADLSGASCETLDDDVGRCWGSNVLIGMNNFTYQRTGPSSDRAGGDGGSRKDSHLVVGDWVRGRRAQGDFPWRFLPPFVVAETGDYWAPWQLRRNWLYSQYAAGQPLEKVARCKIYEDQYHPQPFEQAIRVARAEGHDVAATHYEILKQRIEWRYFNDLMRWGLGILAMILSSLWLVAHDPRLSAIAATLVAAAATTALMINASRLYKCCRCLVGWKRKRWAKVLLYVLFFAPASLILALFWWDHPLRFVQAAMIFASVRFVSAAAHGVMRFGFGYLRRPVQAIGTLIAAFLIGWAGVAIANANGMLIVDTLPVVDQVQDDGKLGQPLASGLRSDLRCGDSIDQPLYALDVLIPLLDLREETRCTTGRAIPQASGQAKMGSGIESGFAGLARSWRALTIENEFFWAVAKVLYAIVGWFIVSLSILTFANIHRGPVAGS